MFNRGYLWFKGMRHHRLVEWNDGFDKDGRLVMYCVDRPDAIYVIDAKDESYSLKTIPIELDVGSVIQVCKSNAHYGGVLMVVDCVHDEYVIARVHAFNGRDYYQKIMHGDYHYIGESEVVFDD